MKIPTLAVVATVFLGITLAEGAQAGQAKMTWENPDKFTDIRPGMGTDKSYRKGLERALNVALKKMAADLPADQTLEITFTDIDLAGEIDPVELPGANQLRLLKDAYYPRLVFNYRIVDRTGKLVAEQKGVDLKDMSYLRGNNAGSSSSDFYYETRMLKNWFNATLRPSKR